jgi:hypothetical protein
VQQDLGVSFYALVEFLWMVSDGFTTEKIFDGTYLVRHWSIVEAEVVGHDERRLRSAADDQVSQLAVVRLHVALTGA